MKKIRLLAALAAAGTLLTAQPVFAAGSSVMMQEAAVITAGAGNVQNAENDIPALPAAEETQNTEAAGPGVNLAQAVSGEGTSNVIIVGEVKNSAASGPGVSQGMQGGPGSQAGFIQAGSGQSEPGQPGGGQLLQPVGPDGNLIPVEGGQPGDGQAAAGNTGRVVDPSRPMVALTFDDGPQPSVGNRIMDALSQYGGRATFFLVGERVPSYAAEVQRMVAEGHEVANHTMNHKYLQKLGAAAIQSQVAQGNDTIQAVSGVRPTLLRLPGGNSNATVRANTFMPMIQWNIDTLDWKTRNADQTVAAVLNNVKDGDIILMHELYAPSGDAAVRLIPELVNRGYQLVTVSEMAAAKGRALEAGQMYSSFR